MGPPAAKQAKHEGPKAATCRSLHPAPVAHAVKNHLQWLAAGMAEKEMVHFAGKLHLRN
jgi:hypothetical protein